MRPASGSGGETIRNLGDHLADFVADTGVEGREGKYEAALSPEWSVWGPFGGYVAAIALRAIGKESALPRPASFTCQFLRVGAFGPVEIEVVAVRGGRRAQALRAVVSQSGVPLLSATAWMVCAQIDGFEHDASRAPDVPGPHELATVAETSPSMPEIFPFWRHVEGRAIEKVADPVAGSPFWRSWMRLPGELGEGELVLDAARSVLWMDCMMWIAASRPYPRPRLFIAPNLDLTVQFHADGSRSRWLLCEGAGAIGHNGLLGCSGRLWTAEGKLVATGTAQLLCQPNPGYAADVQRERRDRG
jgi:acyl-CoA thioesterase